MEKTLTSTVTYSTDTDLKRYLVILSPSKIQSSTKEGQIGHFQLFKKKKTITSVNLTLLKPQHA